VLLPVTAATARWGALPGACRILLYYLLFAGAMNAASGILAANKIPNLYLLHFYTIAELAFLLAFFNKVPQAGLSKKALLVTVVLFTIAGIINFLFLQRFNHFNTYTRPVEALIIAACCLAYFYHYNPDEHKTWSGTGINWMITGMLLYFTGALLLFVFSDIILKENNPALRLATWNIHATLVLIMYLLFAIGFLQWKR